MMLKWVGVGTIFGGQRLWCEFVALMKQLFVDLGMQRDLWSLLVLDGVLLGHTGYAQVWQGQFSGVEEDDGMRETCRDRKSVV